MKIKIFWQPECPNCPRAKELGEKLKNDGLEVELFNVKEVEGLSESLFYDVLSTPSVVIVDNEEKKAAWYGMVPELKVVKDFL